MKTRGPILQAVVVFVVFLKIWPIVTVARISRYVNVLAKMNPVV